MNAKLFSIVALLAVLIASTLAGPDDDVANTTTPLPTTAVPPSPQTPVTTVTSNTNFSVETVQTTKPTSPVTSNSTTTVFVETTTSGAPSYSVFGYFLCATLIFTLAGKFD